MEEKDLGSAVSLFDPYYVKRNPFHLQITPLGK
jgi:hypothetical protein